MTYREFYPTTRETVHCYICMRVPVGKCAACDRLTCDYHMSDDGICEACLTVSEEWEK